MNADIMASICKFQLFLYAITCCQLANIHMNTMIYKSTSKDIILCREGITNINVNKYDFMHSQLQYLKMNSNSTFTMNILYDAVSLAHEFMYLATLSRDSNVRN